MLKIQSIVSLVRLPNLVLIAFCCWIFHQHYILPIIDYFDLEPILSTKLLALLILDIILVSLMGYWANDWKDRGIDRINKPNRFFVKHYVSPAVFFSAIGILAIGALSITLWIAQKTDNLEKAWILPVVAILLSVYALWLKHYKPLGNILVSALIVGIIALITLSEWPNFQKFPSMVMQTALMQITLIGTILFLVNWSREIVKDEEDEVGDSAYKVQSLRSVIGSKTTRYLIIGQIGLALLLNGLLFVHLKTGFIASSISVLSSGILAFTLITLAVKKERIEKILSPLLKIFMLIGIAQIGFLTVF